MKIDFQNIAAEAVEGFKGGKGEMLMRAFDGCGCRVMLNTLRPGAEVGTHRHEGNCEVVYALKGCATFQISDADGRRTETVAEGCAHYCREGGCHSFKNDTGEDFVFLAVVPKQ